MPTLKSKTKVIGITLGDPGGIGPEVAAKALAASDIRRLGSFVLIGDPDVYYRYTSKNYANVRFCAVPPLRNYTFKIGTTNRAHGQASLDYLAKAMTLLKNNEIDSLVTAPICKESVVQVAPNFQGHTEFLAQQAGVQHVGMMFVAAQMRTIIVTRHIPLRKVPRQLTGKAIEATIRLTHTALKKNFKIKNPLIGVCGLNPHAGENGILGNEEIKIINPVLTRLREGGIRTQGCLPADTIFHHENANRFDAIVAMYHDQGLIPIKTLYFHKLVNLTIGLPFVRTSPAHGTAFDIAGKGKANPSSMKEAIRLAAGLM